MMNLTTLAALTINPELGAAFGPLLTVRLIKATSGVLSAFSKVAVRQVWHAEAGTASGHTFPAGYSWEAVMVCKEDGDLLTLCWRTERADAREACMEWVD